MFVDFDRNISLAVLEQYLPRGYGDDLPKSFAGSALAFLERLELLLSIFSKGSTLSKEIGFFLLKSIKSLKLIGGKS